MFSGNPPAPAENLKTLSFPEYLVARKTSHHDRVATLARLIYSSRQSLAAAMPGEVKIEAPSTDKDAAVIVHPGALAYLSDDQKSFFEKYGDYIFYGLLIFPIFGSAIAGVAGYFHRSGRTRRLRLLQRLIELTTQGACRALPGGARSAPARCRQSWSPSSIKASTTTTTRRCRCRFRLRSTRSASPSPRGAPPARRARRRSQGDCEGRRGLAGRNFAPSTPPRRAAAGPRSNRAPITIFRPKHRALRGSFWFRREFRV